MAKFVSLAIAIIVVIVGIILVRNNKESTQPIVPNRSETQTETLEKLVTYTDSGYDPASLTVKSGTNVTFKNESSGPMWTASDPHPTHTDLSGFDSKKGTPSGESYTFKFDKAGTYTYHNHLNPGKQGKIIVLP